MRFSRTELINRLLLQAVLILATAIQQIFLIRVFLSSWSAELYASWLVLWSLYSLIIFLDLGLHPLTYLRMQEEIARPSGKDSERIRRIGSDAIAAYSALIGVSAVGALVLGCVPAIPAVLGLRGAPTIDLQISLVLMVFSGLANVAMSGLSAMTRAVDAYKSLTTLRIIISVAISIFVIALVRYGFEIVSVSAANLLVNIIATFALYVVNRKYIKEIRFLDVFRVRTDTKKYIISAFRYIIPVSADAIVQSVPTLMMGIMGIPASNLVLFTVTRAFAGMVRQVSTASTNPFASEMGHLWVQNRIEAFRETIKACLAIVGGGAGALIGYFLVFQNSLILIWTQGKVTPDPVIFYLLFANLAFAVPSITTFTVLMYTDHPREITVLRLRHIVALCVLCVALGLPFGARGISLAILLSEAVLVSVPMVTTLHRNFGMDWTRLLVASVGSCAAGVLVAIAAGELAIAIYRPTDLLSLAFASLIWLPLPAALLLALFWLVTRAKDANRQEQNPA